jgi:hypothetical protein
MTNKMMMSVKTKLSDQIKEKRDISSKDNNIRSKRDVKLIEEKKFGRFIFKPNDSFKSKWDLVIMLSALFNCFTIPFKVSFKPDFMETMVF